MEVTGLETPERRSAFWQAHSTARLVMGRWGRLPVKSHSSAPDCPKEHQGGCAGRRGGWFCARGDRRRRRAQKVLSAGAGIKSKINNHISRAMGS